MSDEVIWATSMTGDDFRCVHVDDWEIARRRTAELEATLQLFNFMGPPSHDRGVFIEDSTVYEDRDTMQIAISIAALRRARRVLANDRPEQK